MNSIQAEGRETTPLSHREMVRKGSCQLWPTFLLKQGRCTALLARNWWWLFPPLRGFWETVRPFISRLRFVFVFVFVFEVEIRSRALIPLFLCQDESTVAQRAETTVAKCFLTSCVWARFRIGSHTMPRQRHSRRSTPTSLGQRCIRV